MNILGIAFLSDASACVLRDGKVVAAVSEERLNRIKLWHGVPHAAIREVLDLAGLSLDQIDFVATHGKAPSIPERAAYEATALRISQSGLSASDKERQTAALWNRFDHESFVLGTRTPGYLAEVAALGRPVKIYRHHECHAATAYFGAGWEDALVATADGWGEDGSHTFYRGRGAAIEQQSVSNSFDSLGYFYGSITKALGFIPHRHEGKILGLAAHCTAPQSYTGIRAMIDADLERGAFVGRMENGLYSPRFENDALKAYVSKFPREDVAASAQRSLEDVMTALIGHQGRAASHLTVAGGIFANVRLNQRLAELPDTRKIFVFPNMGDGGLSVGAAWLAYAEKTGRMPEAWQTCYLGRAPSEKDIGKALQAGGLSYLAVPNVQDEIGAMLADGKVVVRCTGAMEFGPRALGHRSIMYHARDAAVNMWLNQRLNRSEFMPFAPATLDSEADRYYLGLDRCRRTAKYMTITCDCTADMRRDAPAAVHVDGTARPQLVTEKDHPDFHGILTAYNKRTGQPTVINTSFNMHEEPIVCTAEDAVRAYVASGLDAMALGNFIVTLDGKAALS